jgi:hypothetical protein
MPLNKITGAPYQNVSEWCFETEKISKKNPALPTRASNERKDKETEMSANNIAVVLTTLVNTVNLIITELELIPPQLEELQLQVQTELNLVITSLNEHKSLIGMGQGMPPGHTTTSAGTGGTGGTGGTDTGGGRKGGLTRNLKVGGPSNQAEKEQLIQDILNLQ